MIVGDYNMDLGNILIVDDIKNKNTRLIFDEFTATTPANNRKYQTLVMRNAFSLKFNSVYFDVSLYLQPILFKIEIPHYSKVITMTKLKKHLGWTYRIGNMKSIPLVEEAANTLVHYANQLNFSQDINIELPFLNNVGLEARGSSNWQGAEEYSTFYRIIGAQYSAKKARE